MKRDPGYGPGGTDDSGDRWSTAWCLVLAALLIGFAIQLNLGRLSDGALLLLALAIALAGVGLARPRWSMVGERNVRYALGMALIVQFGLLIVWPPTTADILQSDEALLPLRIGLLAALPIALLELTSVAVLRRTRVVALFGFWALAAAWTLAVSPVSTNDVWWFQQIGSEQLLSGVNPYSVQMPNVFGPGSPFYAPETMVGERLTFGLPYPPLSLFLTLPGYVALGDVRYALLVAALIAALLLRGIRPGPVASGAALLFLYTPRSLFVVAQAWTEPLLVMLLAAVVWMAVRHLQVMPIALALLVAVKQHMALVLPMALLLGRAGSSRMSPAKRAALAAGAAAAITLPFLVWDPAGFWRSLVALQFQQPFRPDALSFPAWIQLNDRLLSSVLGFVAVLPPAALAAWRAARTPAGFAATVGVVYLCFFAFNKQAFANYYYFVVGALCCAVAATARPER